MGSCAARRESVMERSESSLKRIDIVMVIPCCSLFQRIFECVQGVALPFNSKRTRNTNSRFLPRGFAWLYRACRTESWAFFRTAGERGLLSVGVDVSACF